MLQVDKTCDTVADDDTDSDAKKIQRFELLRNELMELEKRVQRSTDGSQYEVLFLTFFLLQFLHQIK